MSDFNLIFERYLSVVNEATPFAAPEEGFGQPEHITRHRPIVKGQATPSGYRLGTAALQRGEDVVDLTRNIVNLIKNASGISGNISSCFKIVIRRC